MNKLMKKILIMVVVLRTVPSILVGATLVVSGDGRYFSKEAIQVLFHCPLFLLLNVVFLASQVFGLSITLFISAGKLVTFLWKTSHLHNLDALQFFFCCCCHFGIVLLFFGLI